MPLECNRPMNIIIYSSNVRKPKVGKNLRKIVKFIKFCLNYDVCWALKTRSKCFSWALKTRSKCFSLALRKSSRCFCWALKTYSIRFCPCHGTFKCRDISEKSLSLRTDMQFPRLSNLIPKTSYF